MRTAGKAGGSAPEAITCSMPSGSVAAVEVAHRAAAHVDGADGQPRRALARGCEVDQRASASRAAARCCSTPPRRAPTLACAPPSAAELRREERRDAAHQRVMLASRLPGRASRTDLLRTRCSTARQNACSRSMRRRRLPAITRGVDRADRRADHPVGLDARLVQRLVHADLVGAERAAALQHQHDLARKLGACHYDPFKGGLRSRNAARNGCEPMMRQPGRARYPAGFTAERPPV